MDHINHFYEVLELTPQATPDEVKQAYRDLVKVWHPDRFVHDPQLQHKAEEKLKKLNEAYEQLQSLRPNSVQQASAPEPHQPKPPNSPGAPHSNTGTRASSWDRKIRNYQSFLPLIADERCTKMITHAAWMAGRQSAVHLVDVWLEKPELLLDCPQKFRMAETESDWQTRKLQVEFPRGCFAYVLLVTLCILARFSLQVLSVSQAGQSCAIEAKLPFIFRGYHGLLHILIQAHQTCTLVEIGTAFFKQWFNRRGADKRINIIVYEMQRQVETLIASDP